MQYLCQRRGFLPEPLGRARKAQLRGVRPPAFAGAAALERVKIAGSGAGKICRTGKICPVRTPADTARRGLAAARQGRR